MVFCNWFSKDVSLKLCRCFDEVCQFKSSKIKYVSLKSYALGLPQVSKTLLSSAIIITIKKKSVYLPGRA